MIVGVLREQNGETRVSLLPDQGEALKKRNVEVWIESNAGLHAAATDETYVQKNCVIKSREEVLSNADVILTLHPLGEPEVMKLKPQCSLIGMFQPLFNSNFIKHCIQQQVSCFSLDMIPRTTRAQAMDVLSSQANIAGYKAVLLAANLYPRYFPMFMTAAGSIAPAKILIIGAGVAGLQAIATGRRLGAVVEVFDTRPAVKEEVMSLGAKFVEVEGAADASKAGGYAVEQTPEYLQKQQQRIAEAIAKADIVITTAQIPGKPAPKLITNEMMDAMKYGSIIIDLAASTGGNTHVTKNNETVEYKGVQIIGNSTLAATMPSDASKMYGRNVFNFLQLIISKEGVLNLDFEDDLVKGTCMCHNGAVTNERIQQLLNV
jgi:NAD(P) transhydrogenase subunit alpha